MFAVSLVAMVSVRRLAVVLFSVVAPFAASAENETEPESASAMLKRIGKDLSCFACVTTVNRYKFEVARHIKTKMTPAEKTEIFNRRFEKSHPCLDKFFPAKMVVASTQLFGIPKYMSYEAAWEKKGTAITRSGEEVRRDAKDLCKYWMDEHRDPLLEGAIGQTKGKMYDVNWHSLICYKPDIACDANHPALDEDDEHMDEQEL